MRSGEILRKAMWGGRTPAIAGVLGVAAAVALGHPKLPEPLYQPGATVPALESCDVPAIFAGDPDSDVGQMHARRTETSRALCRAALGTAAALFEDMDRTKRGPTVINSYANVAGGNNLMLTERIGGPQGEQVVRVLYSPDESNGPYAATYQPRWVRSWAANASPNEGVVMAYTPEAGWQAQIPAASAGDQERWIPGANTAVQQAEADQQAAAGLIARLPVVG